MKGDDTKLNITQPILYFVAPGARTRRRHKAAALHNAHIHPSGDPSIHHAFPKRRLASATSIRHRRYIHPTTQPNR